MTQAARRVRNLGRSSSLPTTVQSNLVQLAALMRQRGRTLAVAESLTCGNIQALVGSISGASGFFKGGATVYDIDQKDRLLGVNRAHAAKVNCVSRRVAREMAAGIAALMHADFGAATTGYAEPNSVVGVDVPFAYCAVWSQGRTAVVRVVGRGLSRIAMQEHTAAAAISLILVCLKDRDVR